MRLLILIAFLFVSACQVTTTAPRAPSAAAPQGQPVSRDVRDRFQTVVERVAPVAVSTCQARTRGRDCRFQIFVDTRPGLPVNAFQTEDRSGRPVIVFTLPLVQQARNADELAFVLGHETAHHILGHLSRTQTNAAQGALIGAVLAGALGVDGASAEALSRQGAAIGSRTFSKEFELCLLYTSDAADDLA